MKKNDGASTCELSACLMLVLGLAGPAAAQSTASFTLSQALEIAAKENPEVAAARSRWEAAQKRVVQAATPGKPRIDLERMYAPASKNALTGAAERNIAVTQETPFPTTLYLRHGRAAQEAEIAGETFRAKVREVSAKTEQAYALWFLTLRSIGIFNENVEIMRRFSKVAEARYAAGHTTELDALRAQMELTRMLNMTVVAEQERQADEASLNALLNRDARSPLGTPADPDPGSLDLQLDRLEAQAQSARPELRGASLEARKAATDLRLAKSEFLPDLMLQYRYRNDPTMGNSNDAVLGVSVPLWFWKQRAQVAEAKAAKATADAELQNMRVATSSDLKTAWIRAQTAKRLADIYRTTLLPQAQASLRVAESGYQAGENSFLDLLDSQRSLLNYRLEYFQDLAEYEQRFADLERVVGKELRP